MSRRNFPPVKTSIRFVITVTATTQGTSLYVFRANSTLAGTKLTINWGDGNIESVDAPLSSNPTSNTFNHVFPAAGNYTIRVKDNNGSLNSFTFQSGQVPISPVISMEELIMPNANDVAGFSYRTNSLLRVSFDLFNYSPKLTGLNKVFQENAGIRTPPVINQMRRINNIANLYFGATKIGFVTPNVLTAAEKLYIENVIFDGYLSGMNMITDATGAFFLRINSGGTADTNVVLDINKICKGFDFSRLRLATQMFANSTNGGYKIYTVGNVETLLMNPAISLAALTNVRSMFQYCPSLTGDFYPVEQRLLAEAPLLNKSAIDSNFGGWGMVTGCTALTYNGQPFASIPPRWRASTT